MSLKEKLGPPTNLNMQNVMVIVTLLLCFRPEIAVFCKFGPKNQSGRFKLKFGT